MNKNAIINYLLCVLCFMVAIPTFIIGGFLLVKPGIKFYKKGKAFSNSTKLQEIPSASQDTPPITPDPTAQPITTPIQEKPKNDIKIETHKVAGVSYRVDEILSLSSENEDYDSSLKNLVDMGYEYERVYQYEFYPIKTELIPEPDNPHDPNAVKVIVDNVHVGYIKSGSCRHILNLLKDDRIIKIDCEIKGGNYKYIGYNEDDDKHYIEKDDIPFFVHLKISVK